MSDTPRTDAITAEYKADKNLSEDEWKDRLFDEMEKLERELAEAAEDKAMLATMAMEFREQRDTMQAAINTFCEGQDWSDSAWKKQPHIAALFNLRKP